MYKLIATGQYFDWSQIQSNALASLHLYQVINKNGVPKNLGTIVSYADDTFKGLGYVQRTEGDMYLKILSDLQSKDWEWKIFKGSGGSINLKD